VFAADDYINPLLVLGSGKEIENVRLSEVKEVLDKLYGASVQTQLPLARHRKTGRPFWGGSFLYRRRAGKNHDGVIGSLSRAHNFGNTLNIILIARTPRSDSGVIPPSPPNKTAMELSVLSLFFIFRLQQIHLTESAASRLAPATVPLSFFTLSNS